jgi:heme A synthase
MKTVPILGTLVLVGAIIQVALGFQIVAGMDVLRGAHALIGIIGLVLVIGLTVVAVRAKAASTYSKIAMIVLVILVLIQVGLGMELLGGADTLAISHEANAILIVILSLITGGLTMQHARHQKTT